MQVSLLAKFGENREHEQRHERDRAHEQEFRTRAARAERIETIRLHGLAPPPLR